MLIRLVRLSLAVALQFGTAPSHGQPLTITASIRKPEIKAGGKVEIWLSLQNTSDRELVYMDQARECDYAVQVNLVETKTALPLLPGVRDNCKNYSQTTRNITVRVQPGESKRDRIELEELFDLSTPGVYSVTVTRQLPGVTAGPAVSNEVQFQVVP